MLLAAFFSASPAPAAAATSNSDSRAADVKAIGDVVAQFQAAIIAHDGNALGSLFLQEHNSWLSLPDAPTWAASKARNPAASRTIPGTWREFADFIQKTPRQVEERFHNVRIETNGTIASVYFDFDFVIDGKVTNRGSESWQLLHAEDGWKITSMLYSNDR